MTDGRWRGLETGIVDDPGQQTEPMTHLSERGQCRIGQTFFPNSLRNAANNRKILLSRENTMRHIFISYSHHDKTMAERLHKYLERRKKREPRVFLDTRKITLGERIVSRISDALNASSTVIVLATKESLSKPWVSAELDTAINLELNGRCRLIVVKLEQCALPEIICGKLFLELNGEWTDEALAKIDEAIQPNIFRNGWKNWDTNFSGNGGSCRHELMEQGIPFYRLSFVLKQQGSFAGVFWEVDSGAVSVANFTSFTCKIRGGSPGNGRLQLKFETMGGWPIHYLPFPSNDWTLVGPIHLADFPDGDWNRLERITIAADDRDLPCGVEHVLDVADFEFFHSKRLSEEKTAMIDDGFISRNALGSGFQAAPNRTRARSGSFDRVSFRTASKVPISRSDYLAITADWPQTNHRRAELIEKEIAGTISADEQRELEHLQSLATSRRSLIAPLPLAELERLHRDVVGGAE